jgi:hypothetical protein
MIDMAHDGKDRSSPPFISAIDHFENLLFKIGGLLFYFYIKFSSNQRSSFSWNALIDGSHDPVFHQASEDICCFYSD